MLAITVREATSDDAEGIRRVASAAWHAAYDPILGRGSVVENIDDWYSPRRIVETVRRDDCPLYVAREDGDLVGFAVATVSEADGAFSRNRVYVHPSYWNDGVGTRLQERIERDLRNRGVDRLRVSVFATNDRATAFCEAQGFDRTEFVRDQAFGERRYTYTKGL